MEKGKKELVVSAIANGTVIDHIPAESLFQVIRILQLDQINNEVLFGTNLDSKKLGKKGIVKVRDKYFKNREINKIAMVAHSATLIEIKDYLVVKKKDVSYPKEVNNIVKCFNPNCVTNKEDVPSKLTVVEHQPMRLKCHYCEKFTSEQNIVFV